MQQSKIVWGFKAKAKDEADLYLYEEIGESGWGDSKSAKQFKKDLDALGDIKTLNIYINSPGGGVFDGMAIYNILKRHKAYKTVYVDGLAASIASVIALAGDKVIIPSNAFFMIHRCWAITWGNKNDMFKMAEELEKIDEGIINVYQAKTGLSRPEIEQLMDEETWMTGEEAKEYGFADEVEKEKKVAASINGDFAIFNGKQFNIKDYKYKNLPKLAVEEPAEGEPKEKSVTEPTPSKADPTPEENPTNKGRVFDLQKHIANINQLTERRKNHERKA
jgi:ATP-dependent Clp protease protease subunit